ncbi:isochorismatase domain-containing protein 1 [Halyomorpha halys]|uniref:isochorismatase domain-containing protein 1 n=1 Tax=Halyomorpha halys TaxID=286706 RepID=UPI0006D4E54C|nr:isochorismatase domain-containing protein 1 [Halyomorpha halys]
MSPTIVKYGFLPIKRTVFFLCDVQEKFRQMVHFNEMVESAKKLISTAKLMDIPLIVTEQYPKGLGNTIPELDIAHAKGVFPKTKFSMVVPEVSNQLDSLCGGNVQCVVLFGIEAHVCVEQTAAELCASGLQVHVVADACTSRTQEDRLLAFKRLQQIGCFIATSENVIFKLLGDKENPHFKEVSALIRQPITATGLV